MTTSGTGKNPVPGRTVRHTSDRTPSATGPGSKGDSPSSPAACWRMPLESSEFATTLPNASSGTKKVCLTLSKTDLAPRPVMGGQCT